MDTLPLIQFERVDGRIGVAPVSGAVILAVAAACGLQGAGKQTLYRQTAWQIVPLVVPDLG